MPATKPEPEPIGLATAIEQLRKELGDAQDTGANQRLRFEITEVEVELLLELRQDYTGDAKMTLFNVVTVGGTAKNTTGTTHRLTLKLAVKDQALGGTAAELTGQRRPPTPPQP